MLCVYLDSTADAHEIGTDNLHNDAQLWGALETMAKDQISKCHIGNVRMNADETAFVYDAYLPFIQHLIKNHDYSDDPVKKTMLSVFEHVFDFSKRAVKDISEKAHVDRLSTFMEACSRAIIGSVPDEVSAPLLNKLLQTKADTLADPIKDECVQLLWP
jgi:hypothetical protein